MTNPTATHPTPAGPTATGPGPGRRALPVLVGLGVVAAAVFTLSSAVTAFLLLRDDTSGFCRALAELPSPAAEAARSGSPSAGLAETARLLDRAAREAPDPSAAAAARTLAGHQRRLAEALAGGTSSADVVGEVSAADDEAGLEAARATLDDASRTAGCRNG